MTFMIPSIYCLFFKTKQNMTVSAPSYVGTLEIPETDEHVVSNQKY
jgi:hypothetical protein